jgi:hypothetical protein
MIIDDLKGEVYKTNELQSGLFDLESEDDYI